MTNPNPFMPPTGPAKAPKILKTSNTVKKSTAPMPGGVQDKTSDTFEVDLTNVQSGFVIPDGYYKAKCTEVEQSVSQSGNAMFVWTFTIIEGEYTGREFKTFTSMAPAALWKVAEVVQALGVGQTGEVVKFNRSQVIGKECGLILEESEYNGQVRSQISRVISLAELVQAHK